MDNSKSNIRKKLTVYMSDEIYLKAKHEAETMGVPVSSFITFITTSYLRGIDATGNIKPLLHEIRKLQSEMLKHSEK